MNKVVAIEGVSGAGKSFISSKVFYELKLKEVNVAIIPDTIHFTRVVTPHSNLFEGGGFEEFSYYYLFLSRLVWHYQCLHTLLTTGEHKLLMVDETPMTELVVFETRGGRIDFTEVMVKELELYYRWIDRVYYLKPDWNKYKHSQLGAEYNRKKEMFQQADTKMQYRLEAMVPEKLLKLEGSLDEKVSMVLEDIVKSSRVQLSEVQWSKVKPSAVE